MPQCKTAVTPVRWVLESCTKPSICCPALPCMNLGNFPIGLKFWNPSAPYGRLRSVVTYVLLILVHTRWITKGYRPTSPTFIYPRADVRLHTLFHDDVMTWKPFTSPALCERNPPVRFSPKGQYGEALITFFCSIICWTNNQVAGNMRCLRVHVMSQ